MDCGCSTISIHPAALGQNRPDEEHRPNDRFVIRKRPLAKDDMKDRFWPIPVVVI
jgi:hypothetical protein